MARKGKLDLFGETDLTFTVCFPKNGRSRNVKLRTSPAELLSDPSGTEPEADPDRDRTWGFERRGKGFWTSMPGLETSPFPWLPTTRDVTGIEENRTAVMDARNNARANGIEGCRFIRGKVEEVLKSTSLEKPDVILLDPPRSGCKEVVAHIVALRAEEDRLCFLRPGHVLTGPPSLRKERLHPSAAHPHRSLPADLPYGGRRPAPGGLLKKAHLLRSPA